jgi:hypothetical protein
MDLTEEMPLQDWHSLKNTHQRIFEQAIVWNGAKSQLIQHRLEGGRRHQRDKRVQQVGRARV